MATELENHPNQFGHASKLRAASVIGMVKSNSGVPLKWKRFSIITIARMSLRFPWSRPVKALSSLRIQRTGNSPDLSGPFGFHESTERTVTRYPLIQISHKANPHNFQFDKFVTNRMEIESFRSDQGDTERKKQLKDSLAHCFSD